MIPATQDLQLNIVRYTAEQKTVWDSFVATSKNGTFLFMRDYMDYHADRFADHSLMFYKGGRLIALLPGNESDDTYYSHGGLTCHCNGSVGGVLPLMPLFKGDCRSW